MNRRSAVRALFSAGAGSVLLRGGALSAIADSVGKEENKEFTIRSDVVLVLLDVSIKDKNGSFVTGLGRDQFRIWEDGKPQEVRVFDAEDRPVTVGLLVDRSRSMTPKWNEVLVAAQTFIKESNRQDEIFIVHFNDRVTLALPPKTPFSSELEQLHAALWRGIPDGKTALNDAVLEGLKHLHLGRRDRKTLVLITDGGDTASKHNRAETLRWVEREMATIYSVGLYDDNDPDRDPAFLRRLAKTSGGEAFFPATATELTPMCTRIAKEIRSRYTIGYIPPAGGRKTMRRIQVSAKAPGNGKLRVFVRGSYRYEELEHSKSNLEM